jgi:ectoine hydroxylase-related dioxygenase (phytanoyl-CoA dioxygenase family)
MKNQINSYSKSSIKIANHKNNNLINETQKIIKEFFKEEDSFYFEMHNDEFRQIILNTQEKLNKNNITSKIVLLIYDDIANYLENDDFLIQSNSYLRVSRPIKECNDSIGWHRENFYAPNADEYVNIWTPIIGIDKLNTLNFIPESHLIKNEDIKTINIDDQHTKKYSNGHKIGLMYSPKKIISGVDFTKKEPMEVPYFSSSIFSGNLIHGAAVNESDKIRFSLDFRIISEKYFDKNLNKKMHFASGKDYFIRFNN